MAKEPKKQIAQHDLIDATGATVDLEENATGFRYTDKESKLSVVKQVAKMKKASQLALAIFGGKTLATNIASAVRQANGGAQEQIQAIEDRFAGIESDPMVWADRTREGAVVDHDSLAFAAKEALIAGGKSEAEAESKRADLLAKMTGDDEKVAATVTKTLRAVPDIETRYRALVGRTVKTLDDLAAL